MSVRDVEAFFSKGEGNKSLRSQLKALGERHKEETQQAVEQLISVAQSAGFVFTSSDSLEARKRASEHRARSKQTDIKQVLADPCIASAGPCNWSSCHGWGID